MLKIKIKKKYKGFSLVESIIGVAIAGAVFVAFLNILPKMIQAETFARDNIVATGLAQEGIEMARNMRDNALKGNNCNFVFSDTGGCLLFAPIGGTSSASFSAEILNTTNNGDFNVPKFNGVNSKFSRSLSVNIDTAIPPQWAEVTCTVTWLAGGSTRSVDIVDRLSAWGEKE